MRLIDADALIEQMEADAEHIEESLFKMATYAAINDVKHQPTIETQRWIPCSERLPEVGQDILMSVGGMYTAEGCLREDGDWAQFRWDAIQRKDMVGAWMPLPEPWRGEEDG